MKKHIISLLLLSYSLTNAQTQWHIVYQFKRVETEATKKRSDSLRKANPQWAEMMQKFRKMSNNKTFHLHFNNVSSLFIEEEILENPVQNKNKRSFMRMNRPKPIIFTELTLKEYIQKITSFQEAYLIKDSLPNYQWKISNETRQIGKYLVIKAIGKEMKRNRKGVLQEKEVIAWFTPQIPISTGPKLYGGLPGLILELHVDREVFLAKEILVNSKNKKEIIAPKNGKIVTQSEFDIVTKERVKKMREMRKSYRKRRKNRRR